MKFMQKLGSFLVLISLLLTTACGADKSNSTVSTAAVGESSIAETEAEKVDPLGKYEPAIELKMGSSVWSQIKYIEGESAENNPWTREYRDALGINLKYAWRVDQSQYDQKVNVVIASGDIPDFMAVTMKQYKMLVDAGLVHEYSDIFDKYALPITKEVFAGNKAAWEASKTGGKLYGVPQAGSSSQALLQNVFIRKDWMEKLNLEAPKTMDDLIKIAEAFTTQDPDGNGKPDTFGFAMCKNFINKPSSVENSLGFFNGFHAYPGAWLEGADGKLIYGSVQPEMKAALQKLQDMYKAGLIDKEFSVKDPTKYNEALVSEKAGIFYGPFWSTIWPLQELKTKNPQSEWETYPLVSADDKPAQPQADIPLVGYFVCSKKYEHPEAIVKMLNLMSHHYFGTDIASNWGNTVGADEKYTSQGISVFQYSIGYQEPPNLNLIIYNEIKEALKVKNKDGLTQGLSSGIYDTCLKVQEEGDISGWGYYSIFNEEGSFKEIKQYEENNLPRYNKFFGVPGPIMTERGTTMKKLEEETFTRIIMGNASVDEFDKFVEQWKSIGGVDVTNEINDWYQQSK